MSASLGLSVEVGEEILYSDAEDEETMVAEESNGEEEEEEYYVEQLPDAIPPSGAKRGATSQGVVKVEPCGMASLDTDAVETAAPPKKRRRRRTVPPEVKKDNHKERERARRNLIKDRFAYLRATIPTLGDNASKMARTEVLDHVIEYIQFMRNRNQSHMIDIENLRVNNVNMEEQTKGLHMSLRYGFKLGGYTEPNTGEVIIDGVLPMSNSMVETMPGNAFNIDSSQHAPENLGVVAAGNDNQMSSEFYHHQQDLNGVPVSPPQIAVNEQYNNYPHSSFCEGEAPVAMSQEGIPPQSPANVHSPYSVPTQPFFHQAKAAKMPNPASASTTPTSGSNHVNNIVIPTTVPVDNHSTQFQEVSSARRCSDAEDAGFGYESPEEEFIMLSELKADVESEFKGQGSKRKQNASRQSNGGKRRVVKRSKDESSADSSSDVASTKSKGSRGRPRKQKSNEGSAVSSASLATIEKIIDCVMGENGLPPKKKQVNRVVADETVLSQNDY